MIGNAKQVPVEVWADLEPPDLVERFSAVARLRRDHVAAESWDATFTYEELDGLSNQLANRLRSMGIGPGSRVAVSMPRGNRELLALLATAKAGAAYVPLDPANPHDRLVGIVEDARPHLTILHPDSPLHGEARGAPTIVLDDVAAAVAGHSAAPPGVRHEPGHSAYILFTSGSTGRPKGVEITRGALANFLRSVAHTPGLQESDRLLAIATTCFDIAELELFLPLWTGATTVIADRATARDARLLRRRLQEGDITVMQATPATWRLLLEAGWRGDGRLRMLVGGEALSPALADRLLAQGGELWNMYGPTETTVYSTLARIRPGYDRITIGKPIDATQVYVLDDALEPVGPGEEGEIWIGGKGLARGYFGRPDLTRERFVQNPHGRPGDRIYRTGDLGRRLADGRFECLGRLDHQVKIRGFRVELGEIESVLRSVPGVAEALVVADPTRPEDPRLVAYWVGGARRAALSAEARRRLPAYMVPAAYVPLEAFPLNVNGKIDRKRLPAASPLDAASSRRPRNDTEARIAAIWADVLGLPHVPVDENFFEIGGTSALAMQVLARLERDLGVELSLQAFFEAATVERTAAGVGRSISPDAPIVVWLRRGAADVPPLFCLVGVQLYQELAEAFSGDRSVVGIHIPFRHVPGRDPRPGLDVVARRYADLVRSLQPRGPYHLLGLCFGGIVAFEVARVLEASGEKVVRVAVLDAVLPSAIAVDRRARLHARLHRFRERGAVTGWLGRRWRAFVARRPALGRAVHALTAREAPAPVDLQLAGPEADLEVAAFDARPGRVRAALLVVRAAQDNMPAWISVRDDQGWRRRAERVQVIHVGAGHLEILREPHVGEIARALEDEVARPPPALPRATGVGEAAAPAP